MEGILAIIIFVGFVALITTIATLGRVHVKL
jgi:hypothetical protein